MLNARSASISALLIGREDDSAAIARLTLEEIPDLIEIFPDIFAVLLTVLWPSALAVLEISFANLFLSMGSNAAAMSMTSSGAIRRMI